MAWIACTCGELRAPREAIHAAAQLAGMASLAGSALVRIALADGLSLTEGPVPAFLTAPILLRSLLFALSL